MACHSSINPLGFSLESFDAVGRWRETDNGKPVDTTGDFQGDNGEKVRTRGARDVAEFAVKSDSARRAFIRHLFHHMVKQPIETVRVTECVNSSKAFRKTVSASGSSW